MLYLIPSSIILLILSPFRVCLLHWNVSSDGCTGEVSIQYSNTKVAPCSFVSGDAEQLVGSGGPIKGEMRGPGIG